MDKVVERALAWRALLPDSIEVRGKTLPLIGPHDYRWIIFNGDHSREPAERFAYARDDFFDDPERPGLYVVVGLPPGDAPTPERAEIMLEEALLSVEDEVDSREGVGG